MLLVIDNYDSFTFNLVQYFGQLGVEQRVFRNDEISVEQALALKPERVMISPGPCSPTEPVSPATSSKLLLALSPCSESALATKPSVKFMAARLSVRLT